MFFEHIAQFQKVYVYFTPFKKEMIKKGKKMTFYDLVISVNCN